MGCPSERANEVMNVIAFFKVIELHRRSTNNLEDNGNGALFTVIICHRKRNPFPFFIDTQTNELARLCFLCNQWSSNFHQGY